jgi:stearoyl-CoA 9-desaturase NADPH oxidoreductase
MASTTQRPSSITSPRRLGRRLLGSPLLEALAAPHGVDRYLELVRPAWTLRDARARVLDVRRQTADSVTLTLRPNDAWEGFLPGQFVQVAVEIDGVRRTRCYSPACTAHAGDRTIELTVKAHPEGVVSRFLNERARPGMVVGLSQARGDFFLPPERPQRVLLISGGSGITPVLSMLRSLRDERHTGPITFLHYAPTPELALYGAELESIAATQANVRVVRAYTRAPGAGELDGHFSPAHLRTAAPGYAHAETFACGPPALLEAVRSAWAGERLDHRLHVESFLPPTLAIASDEAEGTVHFAQAGRSQPNDGRTLLEQAEHAGLTPEFGCRMGICHSCACRKTAGRVRNVRTGEVSASDEEEIQICISVPAGDVELDL